MKDIKTQVEEILRELPDNMSDATADNSRQVSEYEEALSEATTQILKLINEARVEELEGIERSFRSSDNPESFHRATPEELVEHRIKELKEEK